MSGDPFAIDNIISGKDTYKQQRIMLYGVQGIGKSSAAASFEAPIAIRTEDGMSALDIATFPQIATSFEDVAAAIEALHGKHPFKTVVLDSLDWLEPLIWAKTCQDLGINRIEDAGYGKGYICADNNWRYILGGFDSLRLNCGMQVVIIAHCEVKTFTPPDGDSYDRYQPKLHKRAFALWQEWCDNVFFINYRRRMVNRDDQGKIKRAEGDGGRTVFTQERPAYVAKNRWGMQPEIYINQDKTWRPLHDALAQVIGDRYPYPANLMEKTAA